MDGKTTKDSTTLSDEDFIRLKGLVERAGPAAVVGGLWALTGQLAERAEAANKPHFAERLASAAAGLADVFWRLVR
jgi:hypothetical protein